MQISLIDNDLLNQVSVDIVLPNYNSYPFIEETIKSIIDQTFKNWKLFIVDGNSNIETQKIVNDFEKKNKNMPYLIKENLKWNEVSSISANSFLIPTIIIL